MGYFIDIRFVCIYRLQALVYPSVINYFKVTEDLLKYSQLGMNGLMGWLEKIDIPFNPVTDNRTLS
jgi:hypothetical protein